MNRAFKGLALLLLLAATPAAAQDLAGLAWLTGSWRGPGTAVGNASEAALDIRPALGGRFLEFSYRAGRFEGRAFYRPVGSDRWRATWFDNRGASFGHRGRAPAARVLSADWGSAETRARPNRSIASRRTAAFTSPTRSPARTAATASSPAMS